MMEIGQSEEILKVQEKEKEYNGMKVDELLAIAQKEKVDTKGKGRRRHQSRFSWKRRLCHGPRKICVGIYKI